MELYGNDKVDIKNELMLQAELNYVNYKGLKMLIQDIYNELCCNDRTNRISMSNQFSATIAYLGSFLDRRGLSFDYVNSFIENKEKLQLLIREKQPLTIAIPTTYYSSTQPISEIISFVRKENSEAKIIVGGPFVFRLIRTCGENKIKKMIKECGADVFVCGSQGELALANTVQAIRDSKELEHIPNIIYIDENGDVKFNHIELEDNILNQNMIKWSLFHKDELKNVAVRTSNSCPFRCSFCSFPVNNKKYDSLDVNLIDQELSTLSNLGVESIQFVDDTFNIPIHRFKELLRRMIKNKYSFHWHSFIRCQYLDEETVQLMKESKCEGVHLGIESGNQQVLDNMNKQVTIDKYERGINLLNKYEIPSFASFIIGFPGETKQSIEETIGFINRLSPTFYIMSIWFADILSPIVIDGHKFGLQGSGIKWKHNTMNITEAREALYHVFQSVQNSVYLPEEGFDFTGAVGLLHKGMSIDQVKKFISLFNQATKEKIFSNQTEIKNEYLQQMIRLCRNKEK